MHKSNTNSENDHRKTSASQNIRFIDVFIFLYIHRLTSLQHYCSEVIIRQYSKVKKSNCTVNHWKRMIK